MVFCIIDAKSGATRNSILECLFSFPLGNCDTETVRKCIKTQLRIVYSMVTAENWIYQPNVEVDLA